MRSTKITIQSSIGAIVGILEVPEKTVRGEKAVLILHGSDGSKETAAVEIARAFNDSGFPTLRIDMWGFGESDGNWTYKTITSGVTSIHAAAKHLKGIGYARIAIFGTSYSGFCALCAVTKLPFVTELILRSTNPDYLEKLNAKYSAEAIRRWKKAGYVMHSNGTKISYRLYKDSQKYNGYEIAKAVSIPVLLLHGVKDAQITTAQIERLKRNLGQSTLVVYQNGEHGLSGREEFTDLLKRSAMFIM